MGLSLPRQVYCKYCYEFVKPEEDVAENLVRCGRCGYGLAPYSAVEAAGSWRAWLTEIQRRFEEAHGR